MFEEEMQEVKTKLAAIARQPDHWSQTKIGRYKGGVVADVKRFQREEQWWTRDPMAVRDLSTINALLENCGLSKLRSRDGKEEENIHAGPRGITASEVAESQRDKAKRRRGSGSDDEEEGWKKYVPGRNDNLRQWYEELPKHVDINPPERKGFFSALGSYIGKFPASAVYRDVDQATIEKFVKMICEEASQ